MPSLGDFVHAQFFLKIPAPSASFDSKTVVVTGANGGLGKEIVKHIIRLGADRVILGCRSGSRGNAAKEEIEGLLKCNPHIIEVWEVDLESPSSIKSFVDRANSLARLDVLINNAGISAVNFKIVYDTERTLANGVTPHMTIVGSALYDVAKYPDNHGDDMFAWFQHEPHVNPANQYNLSKLLQLYTAIKLSAIVDPVNTTNPNPIVINSVDPCFCKTGLSGELNGARKVIFKILESIAARPAEEGAALVVKAAAAGRQTHGSYMRAGEVQKYAPIVQDDKRATYVWELLGKKLEALQPGILQNLR
ncbi:Retinol dehydrogenase 14 [Madurella mycetomatis]|uniref:Retinol dehydrogenase 14 n=1 Tax=Madurella mycetomatis TaxID=100816 RepID=A0A175W455_9PEZI|nr:Retinol dehydrogenase 14 [Madurella mycetomatis]